MRYDTLNAASYLVWRLQYLASVQAVRDEGDVLQVTQKAGPTILIYMIERPLSLHDLRYYYQTNSEQGIHTLLILQLALLLPDNNALFAPDEALAALLSVQGDRIYAYEAYGPHSLFFPVYFRRLAHQPLLRRVRHGQVVNYAGLHDTHTTTDAPAMPGNWRTADFGGAAAYRTYDPQVDQTPVAMCYALLELPDHADLASVKQAFRRLAKQYHPDLNASREAAFRMREINEAYRRLVRYLQEAP